MKSKRNQPWVKGPADVVPFPHRAVRAWIIAPAFGQPGHFIAKLVGAPVIGPTRTGAGTLEIVELTIKAPNVRCGLPIFVQRRNGSRAA